MIGKTAVVVDSAAYLPRSIIEKYRLLVAPLSVELDGEQYLEGVDITADEFYERLTSAKSVSTSQPAVGRFVALYRQAADGGAEQIVSIHIGSTISGTDASLVASVKWTGAALAGSVVLPLVAVFGGSLARAE